MSYGVRISGALLLGAVLLAPLPAAMNGPARAADLDSQAGGRQHAVVNGRHVQPRPAEVQEELAKKRRAAKRAPRAAPPADSTPKPN